MVFNTGNAFPSCFTLEVWTNTETQLKIIWKIVLGNSFPVSRKRIYIQALQLTFLGKDGKTQTSLKVKCSKCSFHPVNRKPLRKKLNNQHLAQRKKYRQEAIRATSLLQDEQCVKNTCRGKTDFLQTLTLLSSLFLDDEYHFQILRLWYVPFLRTATTWMNPGPFLLPQIEGPSSI